MDVRVQEIKELASFGSGDSGGSGGGRALGTQSLYNRSQDLVDQLTGRRAGQARTLAREIASAAQRRRGRNNLGLSDAERANFTQRLRALAAYAQ